jgi:hypothetical protein
MRWLRQQLLSEGASTRSSFPVRNNGYRPAILRLTNALQAAARLQSLAPRSLTLSSGTTFGNNVQRHRNTEAGSAKFCCMCCRARYRGKPVATSRLPIWALTGSELAKRC